MYIAVYNTLYIIFIPKMDIMLWDWKFLFTTLGLPTADDNLDGYRISDVTSQGEDKLIQDCLICVLLLFLNFAFVPHFLPLPARRLKNKKLLMVHGTAGKFAVSHSISR